MGMTFGGRNVLSSAHLAKQAKALRFAIEIPSNHFRNTLGVESGTGEILLLRSDLEALDLNTTHDLSFFDGTTKTRATITTLHVVRAECLSPGAPADLGAAYRVQLADTRRKWPLKVLDAAYNLRITPTGNWTESTTVAGGGTPYTWAQMLGNIWAALDEGACPALPDTPDGTPEGFEFYGRDAATALSEVLDRLNWSLARNPETGVFTFVKPGATQEGLSDLESRLLQYRVDDATPVEPGYGRLPGKLKVLFRVQPTQAYGENPYVSRTVDAPAPARDGEDAELIALVHDGLPAEYQGGTLMNGTALDDRADARAVEYFREKRDGQTHLRRIYAGAQSDLLTGNELRAVEFCEGIHGLTTEVFRYPRPEPLLALREQPWRLVEMVMVGDLTPDANGYYPGSVFQYDADLEDHVSLYECWILLAAGDVAEQLYVGKLSGYADGLPIYEIGGSVIDAAYNVAGRINTSDQYLGNGVKKVYTLKTEYTEGATTHAFFQPDGFTFTHTSGDVVALWDGALWTVQIDGDLQLLANDDALISAGDTLEIEAATSVTIDTATLALIVPTALTINTIACVTGTDSVGGVYEKGLCVGLASGGGGGGDALTSDGLDQFAATTSAELASIITDETGTNKLVFSTSPTFDSNIGVGTAGGATGEILLLGTTSGVVTLSVADAAGTHEIKLPTADGSANQVVKTDGAGQWGWVTLPVGGGDALTANPLSQFAATTSSQLAGVISDETGTNKLVFSTAPTLDSTVTIGTAGGTTGAVLFKGTTSGTVTLTTAAAAGTHTIKLPTADGSAGHVVKTDGSGQQSYVAVTTLLPPADQAGQETGTGNATYVSPGYQQYHASAAKFWAKIDTSGGSSSLSVSNNCTSVTHNATGDITLTLTNGFSTANFVAVITCQYLNHTSYGIVAEVIALTATTVRFFTYLTSTFAKFDCASVFIVGYGDQ